MPTLSAEPPQDTPDTSSSVAPAMIAYEELIRELRAASRDTRAKIDEDFADEERGRWWLCTDYWLTTNQPCVFSLPPCPVCGKAPGLRGRNEN